MLGSSRYRREDHPLKKTFWVLAIVIAAVIAVGSWTCQRVGPRDGFAVLDASVYLDAT